MPQPASATDQPLDVIPLDNPQVVAVTPQGPPPGRKFPCRGCGAKLDFDPSSQALKCPYCGHVETIAPASTKVEERDYQEYLKKIAGAPTVVAGRSSQVKCSSCGAVVLLEDKVVTDTCPFCASHLESKPEAAKEMIAPESLLPFSVSDHQARESFNRWIQSRWFAPTELRELANLGKLAGVYLPFWTYDSMTYSHYTGKRGDDYQETETYTETESYTESTTDASGQQSTVTRTRPVTKTRTVTKTRWRAVSGNVQHFFDDVLVCGSKSLVDRETGNLAPWDMKNLEPFQPGFLSGFKTERYAVGLEEGFAKARQIMDGQIRQLCCRDIGGDHQTLETVQTQHVGVTFKHLLLPVWIGAYRYRDQPFRVLVNARSGKVFGSRPYSIAKIVLLIVAIVLIIAALIGIFALASGLHRGKRGALTPRRHAVHDAVCLKTTTDYTNDTDEKELSRLPLNPCHPCNPWLLRESVLRGARPVASYDSVRG